MATTIGIVRMEISSLLKANIINDFRGLLQKAYLDKLLRNSEIDTKDIHSVAISSIYQTSKVLNSADTGSFFR